MPLNPICVRQCGTARTAHLADCCWYGLGAYLVHTLGSYSGVEIRSNLVLQAAEDLVVRCAGCGWNGRGAPNRDGGNESRARAPRGVCYHSLWRDFARRCRKQRKRMTPR